MTGSIRRSLCVAVSALMMLFAANAAYAAEASCSHEYETVVVEGTCTDPGMTYDLCSLCGHTTHYANIPALGHEFGEWTVQEDPTCNKSGCSVRQCSRCGYEEAQESEALGHCYESLAVLATCTKEGYIRHTCSVCGDSYKTDYTEPLGHRYTSQVVAPTKTARGYTQYTCAQCGDTYKADYVSPTGNQKSSGSKKTQSKKPSGGTSAQSKEPNPESVPKETAATEETEPIPRYLAACSMGTVGSVYALARAESMLLG